ncbi:MAG: hypothetical protein ACOCWQ_04480 [Nanoarchaeota archaeon]
MADKKEEEKPKDPIEEAGFKEEELEVRSNVFSKSGFPAPEKRYRLWYQSDSHHVEDIYYWIMGHLTNDWSMNNLEKITDLVAASASSSIFGDMQARLSNQQGQVTNLMATIGRMVKDLFGIVRELRMLRERLGYYSDSEKDDKDTAAAAEKTLKGIWIDLVEGGTQNPSSVIGLAQKVGYTILPDLFFNAPPMKENKVNSYVDNLEFNENLKTMLKRKLFQFLRWKTETYHELSAKRNFQIRYLGQHFQTIRMYMDWIKPYLKQIEMLQLQQHDSGNHKMAASSARMDSAYLINSFQGSLVEVETLAYQSNERDKGKYYPCILVHVFHRTMPSMDFHAKDSWQQKGPIHVGRTELTLRAYVWTKEDIENYKKLKQKQDWDLLMSIDNSLMDAMRLLGDDLVKFLDEAKVQLPESFRHLADDDKKEEDKEEKKEPWYYPIDPFLSIGRGVYDLFKPLVPLPSKDSVKGMFSSSRESRITALKDKKDYDAAKKIVMRSLWQTYKNFKKAHRMITW